MTIQSFGPISVLDIRNEFGGQAPDSVSEYFRGGGLVPDNQFAGGVPTSGPVSFSNFYGQRYLTHNYQSPLIQAEQQGITHTPPNDRVRRCYLSFNLAGDQDGRSFVSFTFNGVVRDFQEGFVINANDENKSTAVGLFVPPDDFPVFGEIIARANWNAVMRQGTVYSYFYIDVGNRGTCSVIFSQGRGNGPRPFTYTVPNLLPGDLAIILLNIRSPSGVSVTNMTELNPGITGQGVYFKTITQAGTESFTVNYGGVQQFIDNLVVVRPSP